MTAQPQVSADRRDCALYRFWVRHPVTGKRVLGYIGETARLPFQRLMEHIYSQPWADTIIGWEVDPVTYPGKTAVLAAEKTAIEREQPLYNIECNMGNPRRIPPWTAVEQRQRREPGWQPPASGARVPRQRRTHAGAVQVDGWGWTAARVRAAGWAAGWVVIACVVGWQAASGPVATWVDGLAYGAGVATTTVGVAIPGKRRRRRGRRR